MERKERFLFANQLSKNKMETMIKNTSDIYGQILWKLYPDEIKRKEADEIVNKTLERIITKENNQIEEVARGEFYNSAYELDDPFFIGGFKAIFPLVLSMYYEKGVRTIMLKYNMKPIQINQIMREQVGGLLDAFLREFNAQGEEFYKAFQARGIDLKWHGGRTKGLTRGVISDIYGNMKMAMKKKGTYRKRI